ncbi:phage tail tape measure protein [Halocalculus aciditolerans]|uniref:Phage tail tape measure protein n=1 Tax=Halocalculus aciditolerans TaxID=1383812 RepID=A0A830F4W9_9EURY|nr:hypothetical protein [Halocalculus aciditolerans]GGL55182.1 hypothetical protein GCM10009039_11620 [Halocalculus aciditolerans]
MFDSLVTGLTLNSKGFTAGATRAEQSMDSLEDRARSLGASMQDVGAQMSMFVSLPLLAAGAASVKVASDIQELQNRMEVTFGESTQQIVSWSKTFARETGRSRYQMQKLATTLGTTFSSMGFAEDRVISMSQKLSQLAVDLSSFYNVSTSDALNRLRSGLVGNHEALDKFGIAITEARLKQEAYRAGIAATGAELTEQEKILARMSLIQRSASDAQGDAARTSEEFANQLRSLKAQARETAAIYGEMLIPTAKTLVTTTRGLTEWFGSLSTRQRQVVIGLSAVAAAMGPLIFLLGTSLSLFAGASAGASALASAMGYLAAINTGAVVPSFLAVDVAAAPVLPILLALAGGAAVLGGAWATNFLGIRDKTEAAFGFIEKNWSTIRAIILALMGPIGWLYTAWDKNLLGIQNRVAQTQQWVTNNFGLIKDAAMFLIGPVGWLYLAWKNNLGGIRDITNSVASAVVGGIQWMLQQIEKVPGTVKSAINSIPGVTVNDLFPPKPGEAEARGQAAGEQTVAAYKDSISKSSASPFPSASASKQAGLTAGKAFSEGVQTGASGGAIKTSGLTPAMREFMKSHGDEYGFKTSNLEDTPMTVSESLWTGMAEHGGVSPSKLGISNSEFQALAQRYSGGGTSGTASAATDAFSGGSSTSTATGSGSLSASEIAEAIQTALDGLAVLLKTDDPTLDEVIDDRADLAVDEALQKEKLKQENRGLRG